VAARVEMPQLVDVEVEREVIAFLVYEAELLDDRNFDEWLELLDPDLDYKMPVRSTRPEHQDSEFSDVMHHFDETPSTLRMRVERLKTGDAWAEVPPSRTRHYLTNFRVRATDDPDAYSVRSNLLLMRTRGDEAFYQSLTAERHDVVRRTDDGWKLLKRTILLDTTTLPTYNLAFFL
jgi:ethylbenzene dioxygenase subunit beta